MAQQVKINDLLISYDIVYRKIKYPRLEFKTGKLRLVLPKNYRNHERLIEKHKDWIYRRYWEMQAALKSAENIQLDLNRTEEDLRYLVHSYVEKLEGELDVSVNMVRFRKMKSKWGSCSSERNITINTFLKYLPADFIEYVVFHEMVHLIEWKHSKHFWGLVSARYRGYKEYEKGLLSYWLLVRKNNRAFFG
ncbi:MAG: M48 family metallopeptidase [Methanosarcinaceae archaeon]|nr:M48 family metallopeptidase [Methanosarcinaceae archaeon]